MSCALFGRGEEPFEPPSGAAAHAKPCPQTGEEAGEPADGAKVAAETPAAQDGRTQGDKQDGQSCGMDGIVLPGEQETLEAEQGAQGEEGFRGGGAGNECAVSGYPLGILMEPPRDPGEKEEETKLDKAVQARRR